MKTGRLLNTLLTGLLVAANLIVVPPERVQPLELPPADVMAFVVSGGVLSVEGDEVLPEEDD